MSKDPIGELVIAVCPKLLCDSYVCDTEPEVWMLPCAKHGGQMVKNTRLRQLIRYWHYKVKIWRSLG